MYKQPIIFFGLILPLLAAVALISAVLYGKSEVEASFNEKSQHYAGFEMTTKAAMGLEKAVSQKRAHMERWQNGLSQESLSEVNKQWKTISATLPNKEIQLSAYDKTAGSTGLGGVSAQKSSQVRLAFRGTYRTMQKAFLDLESRMPQLQLQELKIDPSQNQSSLLNLQVTYTAWEN